MISSQYPQSSYAPYGHPPALPARPPPLQPQPSIAKLSYPRLNLCSIGVQTGAPLAASSSDMSQLLAPVRAPALLPPLDLAAERAVLDGIRKRREEEALKRHQQQVRQQERMRFEQEAILNRIQQDKPASSPSSSSSSASPSAASSSASISSTTSSSSLSKLTNPLAALSNFLSSSSLSSSSSSSLSSPSQSLPMAQPVKPAQVEHKASEASSLTADQQAALRNFKKVTALDNDAKCAQLLALCKWDVNDTLSIYFAELDLDQAIARAQQVAAPNHVSGFTTQDNYDYTNSLFDSLQQQESHQIATLTVFLPDSSSYSHEFSYSDTLWTVYTHVCSQAAKWNGQPFQLRTTSGDLIPESSYDKTLEQAGLVPNSMIQASLINQ